MGKKKKSKVLNVLFYVLIGAMVVWLLATNNWVASVGWLFAAVGWWSFDKENSFYDQLLSLYKNHLDKCQTKEEDYKREIAELKYQLAVQKGDAKTGEEVSK